MSLKSDTEAERWVDGLDEGALMQMLERAAKLDPEERQRLLSQPLDFLEDAGLRPPAGVDIAFQEQPALDLEPPPGIKVEIPDFPRRVVFCIRICVWVATPWGFKRICYWRCVGI